MSLTIEKPASSDVLCGQDATFGQHPGNILLREQIELALDPYMKATDRRDKIAMIDEIVSVMRTQHKSRFLRQQQGSTVEVWEEVCEQSVRDKVSHALRFAARRRSSGGKKKTKKPKSSGSGSNSKPRAQNKKRPSLKRKAQEIAVLPKSTATAADNEELDEASRIRLAKIHGRQQKILEKMLSEHDEEEQQVNGSMAFASAGAATLGTQEIMLDDELRQQLADIEPIPFCSDTDALAYCPDLGQYKVEPVRAVSRSPSSSDDEGILSAMKKSANKKDNPQNVLANVAKAVTDYKTQPEQMLQKTEQDWPTNQAHFALRSDDHFSDPCQSASPAPAPISLQPPFYAYHPSYSHSQHIPYAAPSVPQPNALYPMVSDTYNKSPEGAPAFPLPPRRSSSP